jgi:ATP-dependent DNA helicase RecQ
MTKTPDLSPTNPAQVLENVFGFQVFRANQEAVCKAAIAGRDVLLVMPTGAGKSLCYQLPAIVRGGTALVVSPLIALMDDQATKLAALGLRVARIHSGMDRAASREACRDYLDGRLQFFFLAPERLRVPGFIEMLAKRKPTLIAIDEAHCISQWGHDFRPDYRMLRQHLTRLRPAPVIALTATATPIVQKDIVEQLGFANAARFIHGFRRDNLAIEAVEVSRPRRTELAREILSHRERRPAIVYAPTRKDAEETARELAGICPSAAYHAGLDPATRERVQRHFLTGQLEVVVATIAFGMGIDKADVRTVIHTGLPGSLESFYQEIGRAGRDGKPSRTILMHSFADRRTHDFFYQRDYPEMAILDRIFRKINSKPQHSDELRSSLKMDAEVFARALDKLSANGGAAIDFDGNVTLGGKEWRSTYAMQSELRQAQVEKVMRFVEGSRCRMGALVEHFGDVEDALRRCGVCDFCAPQNAIARIFRPLTRDEEQTVLAIVRALRPLAGMSTGKLHKQIFPRDQVSRDEFEGLLVSMAQGGYAKFEDAEFEADGRTISYRKVSLTDEGEELTSATLSRLLVSDASGSETSRYSPAKRAPAKQATRLGGVPTRSDAATDAEDSLTAPELELEKRLKAWRLEEARKSSFAPFIIMSNKALRSIVQERPKTMEELLRVPGMGPAKAARFGESICAICAE